jgi:hypothetical protein
LEAAEALVRSLDAWRVSRAEADSDAEAPGTVVGEQVTVSAWTLGAHALLVVDAEVWAGEGYTWGRQDA